MITGTMAENGSSLVLNGKLSYDSVSIFIKQLKNISFNSIESIDVEKVERIDTAGIACLVWLVTQKIRKSSVELKNCSMNLVKLLEVTGVGSFFRIESV